MPDDWAQHALCLDHPDPDVFFPDPKDTAGRQRAAAECAHCPVKAQCKAGADERRERHGVWGGWARSLASGQPRRIPPPAKCGTESGWKAHKSRGEEPCPRCRHAASAAASGRTARAQMTERMAS